MTARDRPPRVACARRGEGVRLFARGLQKTSLSDFPGRVCCVVFLAGCNLRCPYCHNPELVWRCSSLPRVPEAELVRFLAERRGLIDGVVVSGGEPTLDPALPRFLQRVKELGLQTKLDTNGTRPGVVSRLLAEGLVDYVAMDVKAPAGKYREVTRSCVDPGTVERTMRLIQESGVEHEFRTTVAPGLLGEGDIVAVARWVGKGSKYVLQAYRRPERALDQAWADAATGAPLSLAQLASRVAHLVGRVEVREPAPDGHCR